MILLVGSILGLTIYYVYFYSNKQEIVGTNSFIGLNVALSLGTSPLFKRQAGEILISLNQIHNVKLFNYDIELIKQFIEEYEKSSSSSTIYNSSEKRYLTRNNKNESLQFIVAIPNDEIKYIAENKDHYIDTFMQNIVEPYHEYIQYIALGNEPFNPYPKEDDETISKIATQLNTAYFNLVSGIDAHYSEKENIGADGTSSISVFDNMNDQISKNKRIKNKNLKDPLIPIIVPFSMDILEYATPPSNATFYSQIVSEMKDIFIYMNENSIPFFFNIYPYFSMLSSKEGQVIPTNDFYFAMGHNGASIVEDGPYIYRSLFDASVDSIYMAMTKALDSYSMKTNREPFEKRQIHLTIGETGWPSQDGAFATSTMSCFYNKRIMQYSQSGIGTPRYSPNFHLDIFLFEAFDEKGKTGQPVEKHFGIYNEDGTEKYSLLSYTDDGKQKVNSFDGKSPIDCPNYCNEESACVLPVEEFCVASRNITEDGILNAIHTLCPKYNPKQNERNSQTSLNRLCPVSPMECISNPYDYADLIFNLNYRFGIQYPEKVTEAFACDIKAENIQSNSNDFDKGPISFLTKNVHGKLHSCSLK